MFAENVDLLFFYETSFNAWNHQNMLWQRSDDLIELELNKKQHRATVFGAIGKCIKNSMYCNLFSTTNIENLKSFLVQLKA